MKKLVHPVIAAQETVGRFDGEKFGAAMLNESDTGHDKTLGAVNTMTMCSTDDHFSFSGIAGGGHKAATSQR